MTVDTTPAYNLKVVVQETGIKPDTLRAWERRYGLPEPERTTGKHRLYSQYDIAIIKWLISRQNEGLSISRAVKLWRSLEKSGQDPFTSVTAPNSVHSDNKNSTTVPVNVNSRFKDLRQKWIDACLNYHEAKAEQTLTEAFALYPAEKVVLELLQKGLVQIGQLWYQNKATVQQEHFASALAMRRLNTLVTAAPPPSKPGKIIVACPAEEHHVFAPLFLTLMLRNKGWETIYLGANVPRDYLENTIATAQPDLIIMTAQLLHSAASLAEIAEFLQGERIMLAYGGRIFNQAPSIRERIAGHFLGQNLENIVPKVDNLLSERPFLPPPPSISEEYRRALHEFRHDQANIEAHVWEQLKDDAIPYQHLTNANLHLARDISAALAMGDISLLSSEISWTQKLLLNYNMPPQHLSRYLVAYSEAAHALLGEAGKPISSWLEYIVEEELEYFERV